MPNEIIHVQIGQCGNMVGNQFWNNIINDHKLSYTGRPNEFESDECRLSKLHVYCHEVKQQHSTKYVPRACLADLDPSLLDSTKVSPIGSIFKPDNLVFGATSSHHNRSPIRMIYTQGAELVDEIMNVIRKEAEACESLQAFQFTHSIAGNVGSFMGAIILLKIRDNYPDVITATHSVFPSKKVSDDVIAPYNATLCIHQLLENADQTFVYDNEAVFNLTHNIFPNNTFHSTLYMLNHIIASTMSAVTTSLRFDCELNSTLRRLGINLIPFPRMHFLTVSCAPLFHSNIGHNSRYTVPALVQQLRLNCLSHMKYNADDKYIATSCLYRGDIERILDYEMLTDRFVSYINLKYLNQQIVPSSIVDMCHRYCVENENKINQFVKWIPNQNKSDILKVSNVDTNISGCCISNTTAINHVFQRISSQFERMYKRRAFLHWFTGEGFDEMEFQEADKNVRDLIGEYDDKRMVIVYDSDEEDI